MLKRTRLLNQVREERRLARCKEYAFCAMRIVSANQDSNLSRSFWEVEVASPSVLLPLDVLPLPPE